MLRKIFLKLRTADDKFFTALVKAFYFNVIRANSFILYELDLDRNLDFTKLDAIGERARIITYQELEGYLPKQKELPREFHMHAIDGVEYCPVIFQEDEVACICWIYFKKHPNRWYVLSEREAILNYVYTMPEHRGKGLFPILLLKCAQWLKENNYDKIIIPVHAETKYMINSLKKLKEIEKLGTVRHWFFIRPRYVRP